MLPTRAISWRIKRKAWTTPPHSTGVRAQLGKPSGANDTAVHLSPAPHRQPQLCHPCVPAPCTKHPRTTLRTSRNYQSLTLPRRRNAPWAVSSINTGATGSSTTLMCWLTPPPLPNRSATRTSANRTPHTPLLWAADRTPRTTTVAAYRRATTPQEAITSAAAGGSHGLLVKPGRYQTDTTRHPQHELSLRLRLRHCLDLPIRPPLNPRLSVPCTPHEAATIARPTLHIPAQGTGMRAWGLGISGMGGTRTIRSIALMRMRSVTVVVVMVVGRADRSR